MSGFTEFMDNLMALTAWEMEKPKSYGAFHLIFTFVGFALCVLLAYKLRNLSERGHKVVLISVGAFLVITEVYKQLFYYFYINDNCYAYNIFPFQLCSVPMYLCLIAAFLKPGKVLDGIYGFLTTFNLLGGIMAFIEPSGINHKYWTLTIHAYLWHMMLVFIGFYLIASGRFLKHTKNFFYATATFVVLCAVAFGINLLFWDVSGGTINMFFVGPRNSSLFIFKDIAKNFGWYISTLLYIPVVTLGAYIVFLPVHLWDKHKLRREKEIKQ